MGIKSLPSISIASANSASDPPSWRRDLVKSCKSMSLSDWSWLLDKSEFDNKQKELETQFELIKDKKTQQAYDLNQDLILYRNH